MVQILTNIVTMSLIMISFAGFLRIVAQEHTQQTQKVYQRTHVDVLECPDWIFWHC